MAAGAFTFYNSGRLDIFDGTMDLDTDAVAYALTTATYTPNAATHTQWSHVTNEVTGGGYAQVAMGGAAVTEPVAGTVRWDANDITFGTNTTITAKWLILVKGTAGALGTAAPLIGYVELDTAGSVSSTNGSFDIAWSANGIFEAS